MSDSKVLQEKKGKKRARHEEAYKRNKIKQARLKGTSYKNYKENTVAEKKPGITCTCKKKCIEKLREEDRISIFDTFYNIRTKNEQDMYLQGLITCKEIKQRRPRNNEAMARQHSFDYYVLVREVRTAVCRSAFCNLHAVTAERVKRIRNLLAQGRRPVDMRGKSRSSNAMKNSEVLSVMEHIESFPVKESHYATSDYQYLNAELNVRRMYAMFLQKNPETIIKYEYYNKIFKENFKLSFGRPQIDICNECESLSIKLKNKALNDTAKRCAAAELMVHKRRSKKFYNALKTSTNLCKENSNILAISFDFMQNLQLPRNPAQDMFYLSLLTVSVFCVHSMKTNEAVFFVYHEGLAKKGPNEICSFLYRFIETYVPKDVTELHLFCDNCPGQNKNNTVIRMCSALVDSDRFHKIELFFPIRGHSFLPCDRDFGIIKRKLNKVDRVNTLLEYVEHIVTSTTKQKFMVHVIDQSDIRDFKTWWTKLYKKNVVSVESMSAPRNEKETFNISKYHNFSFNKEHGLGVIVARLYIDGVGEFNLQTFINKIVNISFF